MATAIMESGRQAEAILTVRSGIWISRRLRFYVRFPTIQPCMIRLPTWIMQSRRRDRILGKMRDDGKITQMAYAAAVAENITLKRPEAMEKNNYVETYAYYCATRALMEQAGFVFQYQFATEGEREAYEQAYSESYSECQKQLYTEGYQIYTSFDLPASGGTAGGS